MKHLASDSRSHLRFFLPLFGQTQSYWQFIRLLSSGIFALGLVSLLSGCGTAGPACGVFSFSGSPDPGMFGINCSVAFSGFDPAICGGSVACNCDTICYIQMIRVIDLSDGSFRQPSSDQTSRMVMGQTNPAWNGWAIDRVDGLIWGYYGRNDDGTFASTISTGNNTLPSILRDAPSGWSIGNWFQAVSVPVCIDANSGCVNHLLGFEYWHFVIGTDGTIDNPVSYVAPNWQRDAFDQAVMQWNAFAPALGKNVFPTLSRLP